MSWSDVRDAFHHAADLTPADRESFLASLDDAVRREVVSLLDADARASDFLDTSPLSPVGRQIGPYRLVREIGHGGMGTVYEAEREDEVFRKRVAIKLVRGGINAEHVVRRFRNERQILATLEHTNIAHLIDGGTTDDGLPYFVMELVDGMPIDLYCDTHELTIAQRIELFRVVCSAVQYAHQNLVVHRDLKPSNIVVTYDGVPKLLDFGISKVVQTTEIVDVTATDLRALTPDYASPEQILGQRITTSSDVYSLGVILYRLLTGVAPYTLRDRAPHDVAKIVSSIDPEKPSSVAPAATQRQLRGDLDNIVLMAMQKDPSRRYASVLQLSDDLRRYLDGLPVAAQPDSIGYRVRKYVARNTLAVSAASAIVLTLLGGIGATTAETVKARRAEAAAERRSEDVRKLAGTLVFEIDDSIRDLAGATQARELLVSRALRYLDTLASEKSDSRLQLDLAQAYQKIGDIQGNPGESNLGHGEAAADSYRKSLRILEALVVTQPRNRDILDSLSHGYSNLGDIIWDRGELDAVLPLFRKAIGARERADRLFTPTFEEQRAAADIHLRLGDLFGNPGYQNLGRTAEAMREYATAAAILNRLAARTPRNLHIVRDQYEIYWRIGFLENAEGDSESAEANMRKAVSLIERVAAERRDVASDRSDVALAWHALANPLREEGKFDEALRAEMHGREIIAELVQRDPQSATWGRDLSVMHLAVGRTELQMGRARDALRDIRAARTISEALFATDADLQNMQDLAITWRYEGDALAATHDTGGAAGAYRHGLDMAKRVVAIAHDNVFAMNEAGDDEVRLGALLKNPAILRDGVGTLEHLVARSPANQQMRDDLAVGSYRLASILPRSDERCRDASRSAALWDAMRVSGKLRRSSIDLAAEADALAANCGSVRRAEREDPPSRRPL